MNDEDVESPSSTGTHYPVNNFIIFSAYKKAHERGAWILPAYYVSQKAFAVGFLWLEINYLSTMQYAYALFIVWFIQSELGAASYSRLVNA